MGHAARAGHDDVMTTLRIDNTVRDFDAWKQVFEKFDRFRAERGVRSYRLVRSVDDPLRVMVDLEFDRVAEAASFRTALLKVWETPQSRQQLVAHAGPFLLETVEERVLSDLG